MEFKNWVVLFYNAGVVFEGFLAIAFIIWLINILGSIVCSRKRKCKIVKNCKKFSKVVVGLLCTSFSLLGIVELMVVARFNSIAYLGVSGIWGLMFYGYMFLVVVLLLALHSCDEFFTEVF